MCWLLWTGLKTNTIARWSCRRIQLWRGHGAQGLLRPATSSRTSRMCARWPRSACPPRPKAATITIPSLQDLHNSQAFLSGDHDQFAPAAQLAQVAASAPNPNGWCSFPAPITFLPVN
jgi:hypothetical protein